LHDDTHDPDQEGERRASLAGLHAVRRIHDHAAPAEEVNARVVHWYAENAPDQPLPARVDDVQLMQVRELIARLYGQWRQLSPGDGIEQRFPQDAAV
jgi:hypothetical protein